MSVHQATISTPAPALAASPGRLLPTIFAAMLGVLLLVGVGFAPVSALHNAAHDTRHAAAFPCH